MGSAEQNFQWLGTEPRLISPRPEVWGDKEVEGLMLRVVFLGFKILLLRLGV